MKNYFKKIKKNLFQAENPLLIFLHEGLGSVDQWKDLADIISDETVLPALLYDRQGHGRSEDEKQARNTDYMQQAALFELPALLKKLDIHNPLILIGHSDGASIALLHASTMPENVMGIISIAAHVFVEDISIEGIKNAVNAFESGKLEAALQKYHGEKTRTLFYNWANTWLSEEFRSWNIENDISGIKCPLLVIQGENDAYGTALQMKKIEAATGNKTRSLIVKNAGHAPHLEKKEVVIKEIISFVSQITKN